MHPARTLRTSVTVVIPAKNEAENLRFILPLMPAVVTEVVLVDGRSSDDTIEVARSLCPGVRVVEQVGKGKGNALVAGFGAATGEIIVTLDADGSAEVRRKIARFVDALVGGAPFAKGTRFVDGGGSQDITRIRKAGNAALTVLVNILFRSNYSDLLLRIQCLLQGLLALSRCRL